MWLWPWWCWERQTYLSLLFLLLSREQRVTLPLVLLRDRPILLLSYFAVYLTVSEEQRVTLPFVLLRDRPILLCCFTYLEWRADSNFGLGDVDRYTHLTLPVSLFLLLFASLSYPSFMYWVKLTTSFRLWIWTRICNKMTNATNYFILWAVALKLFMIGGLWERVSQKFYYWERGWKCFRVYNLRVYNLYLTKFQKLDN